MFKEVLGAFGTAARSLFRWPTFALIAAVNVAMLLMISAFIGTGVATAGEVVWSFVSALVFLALFFGWQALSARYVSDRDLRALTRNSLTATGKIALVAVASILLAALIVYSLGALEARLFAPAPKGEAMDEAVAHAAESPGDKVVWARVSFGAVKFLLLGIALPLVTARLWSLMARWSLRDAPWRRALVTAFSPTAVLTYLIGFVVFAVLPLALLSLRLQTRAAWLELSFFGLRLASAAALFSFGWTLTLGALTVLFEKESARSDAPPSTAQPEPTLSEAPS